VATAESLLSVGTVKVERASEKGPIIAKKKPPRIAKKKPPRIQRGA
jgi:hypothetical protein